MARLKKARFGIKLIQSKVSVHIKHAFKPNTDIESIDPVLVDDIFDVFDNSDSESEPPSPINKSSFQLDSCLLEDDDSFLYEKYQSSTFSEDETILNSTRSSYGISEINWKSDSQIKINALEEKKVYSQSKNDIPEREIQVCTRSALLSHTEDKVGIDHTDFTCSYKIISKEIEKKPVIARKLSASFVSQSPLSSIQEKIYKEHAVTSCVNTVSRKGSLTYLDTLYTTEPNLKYPKVDTNTNIVEFHLSREDSGSSEIESECSSDTIDLTQMSPEERRRRIKPLPNLPQAQDISENEYTLDFNPLETPMTLLEDEQKLQTYFQKPRHTKNLSKNRLGVILSDDSNDDNIIQSAIEAVISQYNQNLDGKLDEIPMTFL